MTHFKQGPEANGRARNKTCFISAAYIDFLVATFGGKLHDAQKILWTFGFLLLLATFNFHRRGGGDSHTDLNFVSDLLYVGVCVCVCVCVRVCVWLQGKG